MRSQPLEISYSADLRGGHRFPLTLHFGNLRVEALDLCRQRSAGHFVSLVLKVSKRAAKLCGVCIAVVGDILELGLKCADLSL